MAMGVFDKVSSSLFPASYTGLDFHIAWNNSAPTAAVAGITILLLVPADFPYQGMKNKRRQETIINFDITGAILLIAALVLLVTGLEQGASSLDWSRADVLGPLIASAPACSLFLASQWHSSRLLSKREPLFPWRFLHNRPMIGMLLNCIFVSHFSVNPLPSMISTT